MRKIKSFVPYFQNSYVLEIAEQLLQQQKLVVGPSSYIFIIVTSLCSNCLKHLWIVGMFKIKVVKDGLVIMIAGNLSIDGNKQN